jgi:hypothetical protein
MLHFIFNFFQKLISAYAYADNETYFKTYYLTLLFIGLFSARFVTHRPSEYVIARLRFA